MVMYQMELKIIDLRLAFSCRIDTTGRGRSSAKLLYLIEFSSDLNI